MAKEVIMPALGMAQETGRLIAWNKSEGDTVKRGEILMEVETDKTNVEVEATADGILANITAQPGDDVPVGQVIALILALGEVAPAAAEPKTDSADSPAKAATPVALRLAGAHGIDVNRVPATGNRVTRADVEAYVEQMRPSNGNSQTLASPKARRLAQERGLTLAEIAGSGPGGAVLAADVLEYEPLTVQDTAVVAQVAAPAPSSSSTSIMWRRMAERLTESWQTIPHFYLKREVSAAAMVHWRSSLKDRSEAKITVTDLLIKLVAAALRQHPHVNGTWTGDAVAFNEQINIGLAVALAEGLIVPVIHEADSLGVTAIAIRRKALVERAQNKKLQASDLQRGTFTISNLGMYGVDEFNAIVNPPQAAILAVGRIRDQVVPENGQTVIRPMLTLSLSCDHRAVDGARGAQFLDTLANLIEEPLALLD